MIFGCNVLLMVHTTGCQTYDWKKKKNTLFSKSSDMQMELSCFLFDYAES